MMGYESTVWTLGCILLALQVCNFAYNVILKTNAGPRVRGALRAMLRRLRNAIARVAGALWLLWVLPGILVAACSASAEEEHDAAAHAADAGVTPEEWRAECARLQREAGL